MRFKIKRSSFVGSALQKSWPALVSIIAGALILGGFVIQPIGVSGGNTAVNNSFSGVTMQAKAKLSNTDSWIYTFDERESKTLDLSIWNIMSSTKETTYNDELQLYKDHPSNIRIEDKDLIIEAHKKNEGGMKYTSALVNTKGTFAFDYGRLEVEARLPKGIGAWPAAWLLSSENRYDKSKFSAVTDDKKNWVINGEIDFMEAVGYLPGQIVPAAHSYNSLSRNSIYTPGYVNNPYGSYHRYGIIKKPGSIVFTIDGVPYASRTRDSKDPLEWPFEQSYYLIINLAIGGKWAGSHGIDESKAPWQLRVRSISFEPLRVR